MMRFTVSFALLVLLASCGEKPRESTAIAADDVSAGIGGMMPEQDQDPCSDQKYGRQLNITVFLDLSDRIEKDYGYGQQWKNDTAFVMHLVDRFKEDAQERGTYCAKGRMRLRVEPPNPVMNTCISATETDFSRAAIGARKKMWLDLSSNWRQCLANAYGSALAEGKKAQWPGSDLNGFLRGMDKYLVPEDRNILVILTDGELYAENRGAEKDGGLTANLTSVQLRPHVKGNEAASIQSMQKAGLGLINPRQSKSKLSGMEVIVLGLRPTHSNNPYIYPMLEYLWKDWFNKMGVADEDLTIEKAGSVTDGCNTIDRALDRGQ